MKWPAQQQQNRQDGQNYFCYVVYVYDECYLLTLTHFASLGAVFSKARQILAEVTVTSTVGLLVFATCIQ